MIIRLNTSATIIVIAIIVLLIFIVFRGCNQNPPVSQHAFDSIATANKSLQDAAKSLDSMVSLHNQQSVKEDSLAKVNEKLGDQLELKNLTVKSLAKEVRLYAKYRDTVSMLRAAPLLADEVIVLSEKVEEYKSSNKNLIGKLDSTKRAYAAFLTRKDSLFNDLQGQFDYLAKSYSKQNYDLNRATKKANKKFGAGLHTGVTLISGKPTWIISAGLNYNIIKF